MHSLQLTNLILPRTLSANHVSAVKLKTALLCVSAVISSTYNPPPPRLPPALHPVARFYSQESTPPSSHLQGPSCSIITTSLKTPWGIL